MSSLSVADWSFGWLVFTAVLCWIVGYLFGKWRYLHFEERGSSATLLSVTQFRIVSECLYNTIKTLRNESRGQPLAISRIQRRFNRALEQYNSLPTGTVNYELKVYLLDNLYYVRITDLFYGYRTITILVPAEWVREGIDDVQLVADLD